jgi:hypothetical protein
MAKSFALKALAWTRSLRNCERAVEEPPFMKLALAMVEFSRGE